MFIYEKIERKINIYVSHSLFKSYLRFNIQIVDYKNFIYGLEILVNMRTLIETTGRKRNKVFAYDRYIKLFEEI